MSNSHCAIRERQGNQSPPSRLSRVSSSHSVLFEARRLSIAGTKVDLLAFFSGLISAYVSGIVRNNNGPPAYQPMGESTVGRLRMAFRESGKSLDFVKPELDLFLENGFLEGRLAKGVPRQVPPSVVICTPVLAKTSTDSSSALWSGLTTTHVLPAFGLYPYWGPLITEASHREGRARRWPPTEASSENQTCTDARMHACTHTHKRHMHTLWQWISVFLPKTLNWHGNIWKSMGWSALLPKIKKEEQNLRDLP